MIVVVRGTRLRAPLKTKPKRAERRMEAERLKNGVPDSGRSGSDLCYIGSLYKTTSCEGKHPFITMYRQASKFLNRLNGSSRKCRFGPQAADSNRLGRQDRHGAYCSQHLRDLGRRLDAEVARACGRQLKAEIAEKTRPVRKKTMLNGQRIYLVAFTLLDDPSLRFLKVGVSASDIRARFRLDLKRYSIELLAESQRLTGSDALTAEQAVHAAFRKGRYRPKVPLASGNSECYECSEKNLVIFVNIVNAI